MSPESLLNTESTPPSFYINQIVIDNVNSDNPDATTGLGCNGLNFKINFWKKSLGSATQVPCEDYVLYDGVSNTAVRYDSPIGDTNTVASYCRAKDHAFYFQIVDRIKYWFKIGTTNLTGNDFDYITIESNNDSWSGPDGIIPSS